MKKSLVLAALIASVASAAPMTAAEAGRLHFGKHRHHHHHHGHFHHYRPYYYVHSGDGCGYFYKKWKWTGLIYWKHKYYDCIA